MAIRRDTRHLVNPYADLEPGGRLLIFGRPTLMWDGAPAPEDYYRSFGFSEVHTLDLSARDGATFIHDLNSASPPPDLVGRYRAVNSGGTLEHVFCTLNALRTALALLEEGGMFLCAAPVNNHVDHGFFQISPTAKFDYFHENGLEFGRSLASIRDETRSYDRVVPMYPGEAGALNFIRARVGHSLGVTRTAASTSDRIPVQNTYHLRSERPPRSWRFRAVEPYDLTGTDLVRPAMTRFELQPSEMRRKGGHTIAPFRDERFPPSVPKRPFRSRALVYEDGDLLSWIVSDPGLIEAQPGSFGHFGPFVHFSASDRSDPRENGRQYEIAFPPRFDPRLPSNPS